MPLATAFNIFTHVLPNHLLKTDALCHPTLNIHPFHVLYLSLSASMANTVMTLITYKIVALDPLREENLTLNRCSDDMYINPPFYTPFFSPAIEHPT